jgi:hypothetical protein
LTWTYTDLATEDDFIDITASAGRDAADSVASGSGMSVGNARWFFVLSWGQVESSAAGSGALVSGANLTAADMGIPFSTSTNTHGNDEGGGGAMYVFAVLLLEAVLATGMVDERAGGSFQPVLALQP